MWKLRPGWSAKLLEGDLIVHSDTRRFRITSSVQLSEDFPQTLQSGFAGRDEQGSAAQVEGSLVDELVARGIMMRVDSVHDEDRATSASSRQADYFAHIGIYPVDALRRIGESRVLLLGLGGTGSIVLQHLVAAGVHSFALVDDDIVERSNLERQFIYSKNDIGVEKTRAAANYVLGRVPLADVQVRSQRIDTKDDVKSIVARLGPVALCVICIDRPPGKAFEITAEVLWSIGVPCIHGGVMIRSGFYGPLFDAERSMHDPSSFSIWRYDPLRTPPSPLQIAFAPYNTMIAASIVAESLHYLVGAFNLVDFQHRTFLDLSRGRFVKIGPWDETKGLE